MRRRRSYRALPQAACALALWALAACAAARGGSASPALLSAEPDPAVRVPLPPVPEAAGPLRIDVVYPRADQLLTARDSNFIFGSVGRGGAALTVNGAPVPVRPNGAFLAYLPVPQGDSLARARYELVATAGGESSRRSLVVRTPAPPGPTAGGPRPLVDSASVAPRGPLALSDDERVRVSVRAPVEASVVAVLADTLAEAGSSPGPARPPPAVVRLTRTGDSWATELPAARLRAGATLVVARGADTVRLPVARVDPVDSLGLVTLGDSTALAAVADTDRVVVGRPTPGGTYKWFFLPGTVVPVTGRIGPWLRIGLDAQLDAWVSADDTRALPAGTQLPRRTATNLRVLPAAEWVDVVIPVGARPPHQVEELDQAIAITLYGTTADTDLIQQLAADPLVRHVSWTQESRGRARYVVHLARAPFGYLVLWTGSALVLRVRRPPVVTAATPLRGLTIAVDPGHPPIGATGPTRLYEAVPTLAIGERIRQLLAEGGATPVMTRTSSAPVALGDRPIRARRANAHALVSIHLNALPDGVNPFTAHGTGTYWFHPHAVPLARAVQRGMVRRMGLRDLGIYYANFALARSTWMPAVLCEGAFLMIPEQEAALRTPQYQEAYARGVVEGLERFFLGLAAEQSAGAR